MESLERREEDQNSWAGSAGKDFEAAFVERSIFWFRVGRFLRISRCLQFICIFDIGNFIFFIFKSTVSSKELN